MGITQKQCNFCETGYNLNSLCKKNIPWEDIFLYEVVIFLAQIVYYRLLNCNFCCLATLITPKSDR
jgi:hypothetical protein